MKLFTQYLYRQLNTLPIAINIMNHQWLNLELILCFPHSFTVSSIWSSVSSVLSSQQKLTFVLFLQCNVKDEGASSKCYYDFYYDCNHGLKSCQSQDHLPANKFTYEENGRQNLAIWSGLVLK